MAAALLGHAARACRAIGADGAATALSHRAARHRFQIVTYHRVNDNAHPFFPAVSVERFAAEMELLATRFRVLPLEELLDRAAAGTLPPGAIGITFDDGYRDNYEHAFPVLSRLGLPATIFLVTGAVDRRLALWHDRVFDAFRDTSLDALCWEGERIAIGGADRRIAVRPLLQRFKRMAPEEREPTIARLVAALEVEDSGDRHDHILDWDEVRKMAAAGIDFGAHTVTHTILTNLEPDDAIAEAVGSRKRIEEELGRPARCFAYPNGGREDFDEPIRQHLRAADFRCAVTTLWGSNHAGTDPFSLRRVSLVDDDPRVAGLRLAVDRVRGS